MEKQLTRIEILLWVFLEMYSFDKGNNAAGYFALCAAVVIAISDLFSILNKEFIIWPRKK
jgi:hypothetical protein